MDVAFLPSLEPQRNNLHSPGTESVSPSPLQFQEESVLTTHGVLTMEHWTNCMPLCGPWFCTPELPESTSFEWVGVQMICACPDRTAQMFAGVFVCFCREDLCMLDQTRQTFPGNNS